MRMATKTMGRGVNRDAADLVSAATGLGRPTGVYDALLKRQAAKIVVTANQQKILQATSDGRTSAQIAKSLGLSIQAVRGLQEQLRKSAKEGVAVKVLRKV